MKNRYGKHAAAVVGLLLMSTSIVQAANYINAAGGAWETPANWDTGLVPSGSDTITIAGSAGGQPVVMDTNSWNYIIASNLNHNATEYRTATVLLAGSQTASLTVDIGAGNLWRGTSSGTYYIGNASGSDGTLNVLSGTVNFEASLMRLGQSAGSVGRINVTGADAAYIAGRATGGGTSMEVGPAGEGTLFISDGTFQSRMGVTVAGNGTFEVAGSDVDEIGIGTYSSLNGNWLQASNGVLKVGIDSGGITPILIDDKDNDGPDGFATATFEEGSLLEPYFIGGAQTGKWTVMTVDGSFADSGLALDNGGDTNWSFNITNNILEAWYGLGDSGYTPPEPPAIVYTNAVCFWDGEFGDADWDNPTNWAFAGNNVLPALGSSGGTVQINTNVNYPVYTLEYGTRTYSSIQIGSSANGGSGDGRLDVIGSGFGLSFGAAGTHYCGSGGNTGVLNLDGGATLDTGSSMFSIGAGSGSTGLVTVVNNSRFIPGRETGGISMRVGVGGGHGEIKFVGGRFRSRAGVALGLDTGSTGLFSVEGSGGYIEVGNQSSIDGRWFQYDGGTLQALVTSNGLTTIQIINKDPLTTANDANVQFETGSLLDVDFSGWDGENGSWDVMQWDGRLITSNLAFAAGVDTSTWSFAYVDTDADTTNDTLRITASGIITEPTVQPNITDASISNSIVSLTWDSEPIVGYNVLSTTDLMLPWTTNVAGITGMGSSTTTNLTSVEAQEFYKIEAFGQ
jgi:hypothetical protein